MEREAGFDLATRLLFLKDYGAQLWRQFPWPALALAGLGAGVLARRAKAVFAMSAIISARGTSA